MASAIAVVQSVPVLSELTPIADAQEGRPQRQKKQWSHLSPRSRRGIVVGGIAELIMTTIALRDLKRRPPGTVRGWKVVWVLACFVQPVGPILYFLVGRRRRPA